MIFQHFQFADQFPFQLNCADTLSVLIKIRQDMLVNSPMTRKTGDGFPPFTQLADILDDISFYRNGSSFDFQNRSECGINFITFWESISCERSIRSAFCAFLPSYVTSFRICKRRTKSEKRILSLNADFQWWVGHVVVLVHPLLLDNPQNLLEFFCWIEIIFESKKSLSRTRTHDQRLEEY